MKVREGTKFVVASLRSLWFSLVALASVLAESVGLAAEKVIAGMGAILGTALTAFALGTLSIGEALGVLRGFQMALDQCSFRSPKARFRGALAFTLIELLVVVSIVAILISILLPALAKTRELANRAVCMANIRGIVQSMVTYAQSNNGTFPTVSFGGAWRYYQNSPAGWYATLLDRSTPQEVVQAYYRPYNAGSACPTADMWVLVLQGYATPASFVCPSDPLAQGPAPERGPWAGPVAYYDNFNAWSSGALNSVGRHGGGLSYSQAFPWMWNGMTNQVQSESPAGPWWTTVTATTEVPLISDMAPVDGGSSDGSSVGDGPGMGTYQRITTTLPTANTYGPYIYNSGNHAGDGQNVGFGDDHIVWETSPYVGQNGDNIFTYHNYTGTVSPVNGTTDTEQVGLSGPGAGNANGPVFRPAPEILTRAAPFDTCMTPVRTVNPSQAASATGGADTVWAW